jgi:HEAT repeat protein
MFAPSKAAAVAMLLAATLSAHGGQYRGPRPARLPRGPNRPPAGPGSPVPGPVTPRPGPLAPGPGVPGGPTTPAGATGVPLDLSPEATWETWWEFNKEPFLQVGTAAQQAPITGSDDFYLGQRRSEVAVDVLAPTVADLTDRIVPTLAGLLGRERNRDIATACLIALGKVGRDGPGVELEKELAAHIDRDDQEVRESAVLALGIAGRAKALPILLSLVIDDAAGRKLSDRKTVADRTRAFAAYGLGLLARRSDDVACKKQVHDVLWALLQDKDIKDRDLRIAAVNGLGLLHCEEGSQKRLLWQVVDELLAFFQVEDGPTAEVVQAHAPIAIMRLLGRGSSPLHQRCKALFAATLGAKERRSNAILQSAAVALGGMCQPEAECGDDAANAQALQQHYERGHNRLARYFALISLGRIGGDANRSYLLQAYERSNKSTERPWAALALGLLAEPAAKAGSPDAVIANRLLDDLQGIHNAAVQGALAVAVGLAGHRSAGPVVLRMLRDNEGDQQIAGHLCISLALLGEQTAVPLLSEILERSSRRPFLLQQAAVALGHLGDRDATLRLLRTMKANDSVAILAAAAAAIGQIGDRRSIEPLITMAGDPELTKLARAFIAAALGGVGDKDELRWNVPLTIDCNFAAAVDTLTNGSTGVLDIL